MNILQINSGRGWSGGQYHVLLLSRELAKNGHKVVVVCPPGSVLAEKAGRSGLCVEPVPMMGQWDLLAAVRVRALLRKHKIELVNTHKPVPHTVALIASLGMNVKRVATRHVSFPIPRYPFRRYKWIRGVNAWIATSEAVAESLVRSGIPKGMIRVIYAPLDEDRFQSGISGLKIRREFGIDEDAPVVGQAGDLRAWKGYEDFLRAAAIVLEDVPQARFLAVGRKTDLYPGLKRLAESLGIGHRVHFTDFRADIPECYAAMTVCVSASTAGESAAYALKEPLAMGIPVVATRVGGSAEVVRDGETGILVLPENPAELAGGIRRLLEDAGLRRRMGTSGMADMREKFGLKTVAAQTEKIYQEALMS